MSLRSATWMAVVLAALGSGACSGDARLPVPPGGTVLSGEREGLVSVVDLRRDDACPGTRVTFTMRFSRPMRRGPVEGSLFAAQIVGDALGGRIPLSESRVAPVPEVSRWEDGNRQYVFSLDLEDDRQYVIVLPASVTDQTGKALDGRVGSDTDGDGVRDLADDAGQMARADDDYVVLPADFHSLPFFACTDDRAPSVWIVPLNHSRPRVLAFEGLLADRFDPPRYLPDNGLFPFAVEDGAYVVEEPMPTTGVLRLRIASPNTGPTLGFAHRPAPSAHGPIPLLPSTLGLAVADNNGSSLEPRVYLDNRLQVPSPLVGTIDSVSETGFGSPALAGIPDGALAGSNVVFRSPAGYVYSFAVTGNVASPPRLWIDPLYWSDEHVIVRTENQDALFFPGGAFRANEIAGFRVLSENPVDPPLVAQSNGAKEVPVVGGRFSIACAKARATSGGCRYDVLADLTTLELQGLAFEIAPDYLYVKTDGLLNQQIYELQLNPEPEAMTDWMGSPFVDGRADGNERLAEPEDTWAVRFPTGDFRTMPIPPSLQINDGRWYSPFPEGSQPGATVSFGSFGPYTYLANGMLGRYVAACDGSRAVPTLTELAMTFVTPNGKPQQIGPDDLLTTGIVSAETIVGYRLAEGAPIGIGLQVTAVTVQTDVYQGGMLIERHPATLARIIPPDSGAQRRLAGTDGLCGTADDHTVTGTRPWTAGDRILLSHLISHPRGDRNTLDGNFDGIASPGTLDDVIFVYEPAAPEIFRRGTR